MRSARMRLRLTPLQGGAYTQLQLSGPLPTAPQARQWRSLLAMLSFWNGYPVHAVLSAANPSWSEVLRLRSGQLQPEDLVFGHERGSRTREAGDET